MKHRCCVKGCAERGVWRGRRPDRIYCARHSAVAAECGAGLVYDGWRDTWDLHLWRPHEGAKVGKPRWWGQVRHRRRG